ncbi:MAG: glycosyltransferase family 4 protein [Patescibacteria group bacterium]
MRIAVISNAVFDALGGAGQIAGAYAKALESHGHVVRLWGPRAEFKTLGSNNSVSRLFFHLRDLRADDSIVQSILEWKPDVILTHNLTGCGFGTPKAIKKYFDRLSESSVIARSTTTKQSPDSGDCRAQSGYALAMTNQSQLQADRSGRRLIWLHVLHDVQLFEPSGQIISGEAFSSLRKIWRAIWSNLRRPALGNPQIVISPTRWLLEQHIKRGFFRTARQEVVPNPMAWSERALIERNPHQVVYVGRLDWDKGMDILLAAWKKIEVADKKLVIIGAGSWKEKTNVIPSEAAAQSKDLYQPPVQTNAYNGPSTRSKLAQDDNYFRLGLDDPTVTFKGSLPNAEVRRIFAASAVAVLPSRVWENQPTVILEALQAGAKVVAADVGGVKETLGAAGWIFKPGSVESLVAALERALESKNDAQREAEARRILELHDPALFAARLEGLLKSNL